MRNFTVQFEGRTIMIELDIQAPDQESAITLAVQHLELFFDGTVPLEQLTATVF